MTLLDRKWKIKKGSVTTRSVIIVATMLALLLYVTSVGVSAMDSQQPIQQSPLAKTVTVTSTSFVCCETKTKTVTTTPTTTTLTVTQPTLTTTVTNTVTAPPEISGTDSTISTISPSTVNVFNNDGVDCMVAISAGTSGFTGNQGAGTATISWMAGSSNSIGQETLATAATGDNTDFTLTISASSISIIVTTAAGGSLSPVTVHYSLTSICPP